MAVFLNLLKIQFFCFWLIFLSSASIFFTSSQVYSSEDVGASINFSKLAFYKQDPESYTMYLFDKSRVVTTASSVETNNDCPEDFIPYLRKDLLKKSKVSFSDTPPSQEITKWVKIFLKKGDEHNRYLVARLFTKTKPSSESLLERLCAEDNVRSDTFSFSGGLTIFPQDERFSIIYTFGTAWKSLLDLYAIVPRWGLQIAASENFSDTNQVREIAATYYRNPIPSMHKERSSKVDHIERFGIEVGSEGIETLRIRALGKYGTKKIFKGSDFLSFEVCNREGKAESTLQTLKIIAYHFFNYKPLVHRRLKCFVDSNITDTQIQQRMSQKLFEILKAPESKHYILLHNWIFGFLGSKSLRFGELEKAEIYDIFSSIVNFEHNVKVKTVKGKKSSEVPIKRLLYSLPIEDPKNAGHFYRFDRDLWFEVDASRFDSIKKILRTFKIPKENLGIPGYCIDDTMGETRKDYKEFRYNKRAVDSLNMIESQKAFLIDRINVGLGKQGHIFEFGDIFLIKDDQYYIIHVKRADAGSLSHHREQVERSAEFLATNLIKEDNHLFLKAAIKDLYRENEIEQEPFIHENDEQLIENYSEEFYNIFMSELIKIINKEENKNLKSFFDKNPSRFCDAVNALFQCAINRNIESYDKDTIVYMTNFLNKVKDSFEVSTEFFSKGVLKKGIQKRITFVLAVLDDRGVEKFIENESKKHLSIKRELKESSKKDILLRLDPAQLKKEDIYPDNHSPLFKNQDLWGLDRSRMLIQKHGFKFSLIVTNESQNDNWDAFGQINPDSTDDYIENEASSNNILDSFYRGTTSIRKPNYEKIVNYLKENPDKSITNKEAGKLIDINIGSYIKDLVRAGILIQDASKKTHIYCISPSISLDASEDEKKNGSADEEDDGSGLGF